jgi:hypothetical protein
MSHARDLQQHGVNTSSLKVIFGFLSVALTSRVHDNAAKAEMLFFWVKITETIARMVVCNCRIFAKRRQHPARKGAGRKVMGYEIRKIGRDFVVMFGADSLMKFKTRREAMNMVKAANMHVEDMAVRKTSCPLLAETAFPWEIAARKA